MKKIFAIASLALVAAAMLFLNPARVRAAIEAVFNFSFTESIAEYVPLTDTSIDRATGTIYVLTSGGEVQVFDTEGARILSFTAAEDEETLTGIATDPISKNIFVVSSEGMIKVFDDEGAFVEAYGQGVFVGVPRRIAVDENGSYVSSEEDQAVYFFDTDHELVETAAVAGAYYIETDAGTVYVPSSGQVIPYSPLGVPGVPVDITVEWSDTFAVRPNNEGFAFSFNSRDGSYVIFSDAEGNEDGAFADDGGNFRVIRSIELKMDGTLIVALGLNEAGNIKAYNLDTGKRTYYLPKENPGIIYNGKGIAVDSDNDIFIADADLNKIKKYNEQGEFITSFGSEGSGDGEFFAPYDVALDSSGNLYVADKDNLRVQVLDTNGAYLRQWEVTEEGSYGGPSSLGILDDKVYVTGRGGDDRLIQVFSLEGTPLFTFGGSDGEIEGQFYSTDLLSVGADGKIYVFDAGQKYISVFSSNGSFIERFGEFTVEGTPEGIFFDISDFAIDEYGNIFLADYSNSRVLILNANRIQVGAFGSPGIAEGEFSETRGIALADEIIYVGDYLRTQVFSYSDDVRSGEENGGHRKGRVIGNIGTKDIPTIVEQIEDPALFKEICEEGPFINNLRRGMLSPEVARVQNFLRASGVYSGPTTSFFGPLTEMAVQRFQLLHREQILTPAGLFSPTGYWYPYTRAHASQMLHCDF